VALFKKHHAPRPAEPPWSPTVDLATARPAIFALAMAPESNDAQVRSAVATFVRLSERPSTEDAYQVSSLMRSDPEMTFLERPWMWLTAAMREAAAAEDHHLAAAALFWACYWTSNLVPRANLAVFMELRIDPIKPPLKAEILSLGVASAQELPSDFIVVGDATGSVLAGWLAESAAFMLDV
jgi:nitroreductase